MREKQKIGSEVEVQFSAPDGHPKDPIPEGTQRSDPRQVVQVALMRWHNEGRVAGPSK